jgi:hypothetical protein
LALSAEDLNLLLNALLTLTMLQERMADYDVTLHKLRKLAGIVRRSEKLSAVLPNAGNNGKPPNGQKKRKRKPKPPAEPIVHDRQFHPLEGVEKGQCCPQCQRGKTYDYAPAVFVRVSARAPLSSTEHILQRRRCNTCGTYFTATPPAEVTDDGAIDQRYGYSARAMMAVQRYFAGAPFARQETLQQLFGFPVAASTVFDQCEQLSDAIHPVFKFMKTAGARAQRFLIDDTTHRILEQPPVTRPDRRTGKPRSRTGVYTSALIAIDEDEHRYILFQTNVGHAGEWLDQILHARPATAPAPIVMSDALSRNRPYAIEHFESAFCNAHARRQFVDVASRFPEQADWVLERYGLIWQHDDDLCAGVSPAQRLAIHREHSLPVMEQIRDHGQQSLDSGRVESNSALGEAWRYFLSHFHPLTAFCRLENAPIDNNSTEQELRLIIRGRNNSLFFKTPAGAAIADVITSVVATAYRAGINVFDYLIDLQRHADDVKRHPERWLPWAYRHPPP